MIDNDLGQQLHDRATCGVPLTTDEQQQLDAWYKQLDAEEEAILARPSLEPMIAEVRRKIDQTLAEIAKMKKKIREVKRRTATMKRENRLLLQLLLQRQPASRSEILHGLGYINQPQSDEEINEWLPEQAWPE